MSHAAGDEPDEGQHVTKSEWVEQRLHAAIVFGDLAPGSKIDVARLVSRWSVSPTPLREAIQRLASRGIVEISPQRGAYVAPLSIKDLREIYELRLLLEPLAAEQSVANFTPDDVEQMRMAAEELAQAYQRPTLDRRACERAHRAFHLAVLARCPSAWLLRTVTTLLDHSSRYRMASTERRGGGEAVAQEHARVLDAATRGDTAAVSQLIREHLQKTYSTVMESQAGRWMDAAEPAADESGSRA